MVVMASSIQMLYRHFVMTVALKHSFTDNHDIALYEREVRVTRTYICVGLKYMSTCTTCVVYAYNTRGTFQHACGHM